MINLSTAINKFEKILHAAILWRHQYIGIFVNFGTLWGPEYDEILKNRKICYKAVLYLSETENRIEKEVIELPEIDFQ